MKKTMLTAPFESPVVAALCVDAKVAGREVAALSEAESRRGKPARRRAKPDGTEAPGAEPPAAAMVPWDPNSFVSARVAFQEAENALGPVEEAVVAVDPAARPASDPGAPDFARLPPARLDEAVAREISGPAHLVHEALRRFDERGSGTLVVALGAGRPGDALHALALGAMGALAESLAASRADSPVRVVVARDESGSPEGFAQFLVRALADPRQTDKTLRYTGRAGLFGKL